MSPILAKVALSKVCLDTLYPHKINVFGNIEKKIWRLKKRKSASQGQNLHFQENSPVHYDPTDYIYPAKYVSVLGYSHVDIIRRRKSNMTFCLMNFTSILFSPSTD